jgi:hypothetical protein
VDEIEKILGIINSSEIRLSGQLSRDFNSPGKFYAFIEIDRDQNNKQQPSNRKIENISHSLSAEGIFIEFILIDKSKDDIESGIRANLIRSFGDIVRNVFLSIANDEVNIWIDPKRLATEYEFEQMYQKSRIYFDSFDMILSNVFFTSSGNLPTKIACLRALRTVSPADISKIAKKLSDMGFVIPSETWLSHRMDHLRKGELAIRLRNGNYALTHGGLSLLGTTKNARSPDISRLLDLARRGK